MVVTSPNLYIQKCTEILEFLDVHFPMLIEMAIIHAPFVFSCENYTVWPFRMCVIFAKLKTLV